MFTLPALLPCPGSQMAMLAAEMQCKNSEHPVVSLLSGDRGHWALHWGKEQSVMPSSAFLLPGKLARSCLDAAQALQWVCFWWQTNINSNSTDASVVTLVRLSQLREKLIGLLLTLVLQPQTPTETGLLQIPEWPSLAWLCGTLGKRTCCCATGYFVLWSSEHCCLWYS